jgi:hypothetical protein
MEAIIQEIDVKRLFPIFDILSVPKDTRDTWNGRVEVTIKPVEKQSNGTTAERIAQFRKKHNRETFVEHLKEQVAKGRTFEFDVQKVIDGTETEEDEQARYRLEKQVWGKVVADKTGGAN